CKLPRRLQPEPEREYVLRFHPLPHAASRAACRADTPFQPTANSISGVEEPISASDRVPLRWTPMLDKHKRCLSELLSERGSVGARNTDQTDARLGRPFADLPNADGLQ